MATKPEEEMFEQISMDFQPKHEEVDLLDIPVKTGENTSPKTAETVSKSRSQIVHEVLDGEDAEVFTEVSERTLRKVETKISVFFDNTDLDLKFSKKFTVFDKEVIDAVSTLAQISDVMNSASIYRTITGKQEGQYINPAQRARVEESMEKCRTCIVSLSLSDGEQKQYRSSAIAFSNLITDHKKSETMTYYKILEIPILYRLAETLGKISSFPSVLLDTPVSKTESVIAIQSFLLKSIDLMQKNLSEDCDILWSEIYKASGKEDTKQYRSNTRELSKKILAHWVDQGFILGYSLIGKGRASGLSIELQEKT